MGDLDAILEMHFLILFRQQAIIWVNVDPDLCRHVATLGHNESINTSTTIQWILIIHVDCESLWFADA